MRGQLGAGRRIAVLAVLAAVALLALPAGAAAGEPGQITGLVTAGKTAIKGLYVCASATVGNLRECVSTNASGEYSIELPAGSYTVEFRGENCENDPCQYLDYLNRYWEEKTPGEEPTPVVVKAGSPTPGIDAEMKAGGTLEGQVTESEGEGIEGDEVCVYSDEAEHVSRCVRTDEKGNYSLVGLPTQNYTIEFYRLGNFVGQYYENKRTEQTANLVKVVAGEEQHVNGARLNEGGKIKGVVTAAAGGAPIEGITVCPRTVGTAAYAECQLTNNNGEYTLEALEGEYGVSFEGNGSFGPELYENATSEATEKHIKTTPGNTVEGINARLTKTVGQLEEETEKRTIAEAIAKKHAEEVAQQEAVAKAAAAKAAAVKHAEEVAAEAAKRKALGEHEHAEAAALASFRILRVSSTGTTLIVTVKLSAAENLTLGGPAFKRTVVHGRAGKHVFRIPLSPTGRAARRHRRKATLTVSIKEGAFIIVLSTQLKF